MNSPMIPSKYKVVDKVIETENSFTLTLSDNEEHDSSFKSGQFNMLYVFGIGEVAISISGSSDNNKNISHTIRTVGKVTEALGELSKGDVIGVRGAFGSVWPLDSSHGKDLVIMAGGCGLAPLRSAIYQIIEEREKYGMVTLLYGVKSIKDVYFADELTEWAEKSDIKVVITADIAEEDNTCRTGLVTELVGEHEIDSQNTIAMVCGPEIMMKCCADVLISKNLPKENIYLSLERNMKCAIGICGRCQFGGDFICKDGPIFSYDKVENRLQVEEL